MRGRQKVCLDKIVSLELTFVLANARNRGTEPTEAPVVSYPVLRCMNRANTVVHHLDPRD